MLYELQKALMTRYNSASGATLRGMVQGMWEDEAPSSVVLGTQNGQELKNSVKPFIVFTIVTTGLNEQDFCSDFYNSLVQFTIFGDADNLSSSDLLLAQSELLGLFGGKTLSMDSNYTMIRSDIVDQRKFKDSDKMWNVITELSFVVQKSITRESI